MNEKVRKRRDFIQNITIALLSVSAVLLFTQTQMYSLVASAGSNYWSFLASADTQAISDKASQDAALSAPVQVAVTGPYGRFGSVSLTTMDDTFAPLRSLLEQALGSARTYTPCDQDAFLNALQGTSVYCNFLSPLPLSVLADLMWTSGGDDTVFAQRLIVAEQDGHVVLYLWDDGETYLRCDTALSPEILAETVNQYEIGNAQFAFDASLSQSQELSPFSLFLVEEPLLPVLAQTVPQPDTDRLLAALDFNPNTQNRYPDPSGTEVIMESGCTLRIHTDGTISYRSSGDAGLSIGAASEIPTALEAVTGIGSLLNTLLLPTMGDATLCLEAVQQSGDSSTLRFGYHVNGVPIRFSDGQSAVEVTLSGTVISSMTLRIRQYTITEETALLLPLRQASAIAALHSGAELSIGYADNSSGSVSAQWVAD